MRSALLLPPLMVLACGALCPGYTNKGGGRSAEKATKRTIYHSKPGGISLALSSDGRSLFVVNWPFANIAWGCQSARPAYTTLGAFVPALGGGHGRHHRLPDRRPR